MHKTRLHYPPSSVLILFCLAACLFFRPQGAGAGGEPVRITVKDAVLMALKNNRALVVENLKPEIRKTFEDEEEAVFDPVLKAEARFAREKALQTPSELSRTKESSAEIGAGVSKRFATGTDLSLDLSTSRTWSDRTENLYQSRLGLSVTQALLRGRGVNVNLVGLRQARLKTRLSAYELRGFSEALVAHVETTYWDYILARRQIEIFENSLDLARQQLAETQEIIKVGKLAETEMVAAQAEIALRTQELIEARNTAAVARLQLLRLINPPGPDPWGRELVLMNEPLVPDVVLEDVTEHVKVAMRMRPDLNQARLDIQNNELELVKTKNGLLPKMDLFMTLGKSGYSDSFGGAFGELSDEDYDALAGLRFEFPFRNRAPKALNKRAELSLQQAEAALNNLRQLVELDVRTAYIELNRAEQQIQASRASRELEEEKVRIETEKFRVGKSTSFLVAQAQRDLVRARISEIRSVVTYLKALVDLHRLEGSLLERWGIRTYGSEPLEG